MMSIRLAGWQRGFFAVALGATLVCVAGARA